MSSSRTGRTDVQLSRGDLLYVAKCVLFKTTAVCSRLGDSEESRDRHWQSREMDEKRQLLSALAQGLSEVGIEVEERRTRISATEAATL